jgi:hypothetical protein
MTATIAERVVAETLPVDSAVAGVGEPAVENRVKAVPGAQLELRSAR